MADTYKVFCDYIQEQDLLEAGDHVIAGVSGGADSMCLLILLEKLAKEMDLQLTAVHVNHHLRGDEAGEDEAFVKEFCSSRGIRCVAVQADVKSFAQKQGLSLEEAGRIARYKTFQQLSAKISDAVGHSESEGGESKKSESSIRAAVAHHKDDNAETVLLNLARGTGLKGLRGMQPRGERFGITVIRPLLCLGREEIEAYLKEEEVSFRTDSTNKEDEFARNKIRLHVIPELTGINSKASEHINEAAKSIVRAQEFIERESKKAIARMTDEREDGTYIDLNRFSEMDVVVREQMIRDLAERIGGSLKDVGRVHIESVLGLCEKQTGRQVTLPYDVIAIRSYSNLIMRKATPADKLASDMTEYARNKLVETIISAPEMEEEAQVTEEFIIDPSHLPMEPVRFVLWDEMEIELCLVHSNPVTRQYLTAKNKYTKAFDCAKIKGNLILRKPDPHEEIRFFGGSKSIKKFFTDEKVPQELRSDVLVLSDEEEIMWIIGYRMSETYKITDMTNMALQVSIYGGRYEE